MERSLKTVSQTEDFSNRPPGSVEMTEELVSGAVEMAGELVSGFVEMTDGDAPNQSSRLEAKPERRDLAFDSREQEISPIALQAPSK